MIEDYEIDDDIDELTEIDEKELDDCPRCYGGCEYCLMTG